MSALDTEFVDQLQEDLEPDDFRLVVETFARDLEQLTAAMQAAADAGDRVGFSRRAHRLAGAAAALGARGLSQLAHAATDPDAGHDLHEALRLLRSSGDRAHAELRLRTERHPRQQLAAPR